MTRRANPVSLEGDVRVEIRRGIGTPVQQRAWQQLWHILLASPHSRDTAEPEPRLVDEETPRDETRRRA
jgi:hypothetical protein